MAAICRCSCSARLMINRIGKWTIFMAKNLRRARQMQLSDVAGTSRSDNWHFPSTSASGAEAKPFLGAVKGRARCPSQVPRP
jgi:hypothetical protein